MVKYTWSDLKEDGNDFGKQIANNSKRFACSLWKNYPRNFVGDNPVSNPIRQFWNNLCEEDPPVIPPAPFYGGQCPVKYNVNLQVAVFPSSTNCDRQPNSITPMGIQVWGPINTLFLDEPFGDCGGFKSVKINHFGLASSSALPNPVTTQISSSSYGRFKSIFSVTIVRQDGQSDSCGNAPGINYPPTPAPNPGEEIYNVIFEGDETNQFNFPLIWNKIDFQIPLIFDFEIGNVNINFDGIDLNFNPDNNWNINPPNNDIDSKITNFIIEFESVFYLPF